MTLTLTVMLTYVTLNADNFEYEEFEDKYGAIIEGTRHRTPE